MFLGGGGTIASALSTAVARRETESLVTEALSEGAPIANPSWWVSWSLATEAPPEGGFRLGGLLGAPIANGFSNGLRG